MSGDNAGALADYDEAIRLDPGNVMAYTARGGVYLTEGDFERAVADYNEVIRINPSLPFGFYNRGNAYARLGDYDSAIADFDAAMQMDPTFIMPRMARGSALAAKGDLDAAIANYGAVIELEPNSPRAYSNRALVFCHQARLRPRHRRTTARPSGWSPTDPLVYYTRGLAYYAKGDIAAPSPTMTM